LNARDFPAQLHALAILLPRRNYATETSTQGSESGPPPGFNIKEAKKPLAAKSSESAQPATESKNASDQVSTPRDAATAVDKTTHNENASLSELAAEKSSEASKADGKSVAVKAEETKKLTIGQKIIRELVHYWDGTKLLATEVRISSKLALKMAAGYELSRREHRQVSIPSLFWFKSC
jgi:LETM1 and EF-hand domain-containing protein 1, mitochondrial